MYLTRSITRGGVTRQMAGVIPAETHFTARPVGYGYVSLSPRPTGSWLRLTGEIRAHEFHYSWLEGLPADMGYLYTVQRGTGMGGGVDGVALHNLVASYAHLHSGGAPGWAESFVSALLPRR